MGFSFELLLTLAVLVSGFVWLLDTLFWARKRPKNAKVPLAIEYSRSFFPVLLIVLLLRSFLLEPFRIPSGSDEPTLLVGDFIVANKFIYGLRLPVIHTKFMQNQEPATGDIVLFRWPVDPSQNFIKRVIGVPGDQISYVNKVLYINGVEAKQTILGQATDEDGLGHSWPVTVIEENLMGIKHKSYLRSDVPVQDFSLTVPQNMYFVMGDNRDSSNDSRYWGFVPESNFVGKAYAIWFSWNGDNNNIRWGRMGSLIH